MKFFKQAVILFAAAVIITFSGLAVLTERGSGLFIGSVGDVAVAATSVNAESSNARPVDQQTLFESYGKLPIAFEPNIGQTDDNVRFVARGQGYAMFLTDTEATLELRGQAGIKKNGERASLSMKIEGADPSAVSQGLDATEGRSNYFIGNDPSKWRADVPNFGRVRYEKIYPGVDVVFYGNGQKLEYDFVVAPYADPNAIALNFSGASSAKIDKPSGDLLLKTQVGTIRQLKPLVYQEIGGERTEVASTYKTQAGKDGDLRVSFDLGSYDHSKELIIDPILAYGAYLGGAGFEEGRGIAVDAAGNAYIVGTTTSLNFPTTPGTIKPVLLPRTGSTNSYWYDAFVTKVNPAGTAIVFSTYYGGREGSEIGTGVAVTPTGEVLISGTTTASDFPTVNAYQSTFGGTDDAFAAKLNSTGSAIIYSTFLGGNNTDLGGRIALNPATGDAVFAGYASSPNFPTTPGAYKERLCSTPVGCSGIFYSGSYAVRLSAAGNGVFSTLFDAGISDVKFDSADNAVFGGSVGGLNFPTTAGAFQPSSSGGIEGFIAKLNPAGSAVVYGTYLGGGLQSDRINGITLDAAGNMYVTGQTENAGFPVTPGAYDTTYNGGEDGFVTKLDPTGSSLVYSTFFGGLGKDQPFAIGLGADNSVIIAGETLSGTTFPLRNSLTGTSGSIFVTRFDANATAIVYSTLLGQGGAYGLAVDGNSSAYITGHTTNVVVTPDSFQPNHGATDPTSSSSSPKDAFVLKIATGDENATSYAISGTVTDDNYGFNNDYTAIVVNITGTVNRSYSPPNGGSGTVVYYFGNLPPGGNYTITAHKLGYETAPDSVQFNNLGANQSADFHILRNQAPVGTVTSPVHGTTFNAPATITIQATATDPDGDPIQKVDFVAYNYTSGTSMPLGTDTTAPYEFTWQNIPVGTYGLYAFPTDSHGLRGISGQVVHVFVVDSSAVSVAFIAPLEGSTWVEGDYIPISMAVSPSVILVQVRDQNNNLVAWLPNSPWSNTWRPFVIGDYTLTATAQNSQGQTATAVIHITVAPINHRISGIITDSITNLPVSGVNLDLECPSTPSITARTTTDANGYYLFTDLGTTPNDSVRITPTLAGYTFNPPNRATGYMGYINWPNQYYSATRTSNITVNMTSPAPSQVFTAPASFTLAADASTTGGTITKVEFYRQAFTPVLLGTDTTAPYELPVTGLAAGNYGYFARATDSTDGVADSSTVNITVVPAVTTVSLHGVVNNPGGGPMVGITVRLTGTANGNPVNQTWVTNTTGSYGFFGIPAGGNYTITPEAPNTTFTPPSASFTNVTQDIYDIDFVASAPNQAPTVQINSPADGSVFTMPAAIPINVTAQDSDGSVVHLSISAISATMATTIGQSNNGVLNFSWQPNLPGSYTLSATALDNGGLRTTTSISITVNPPTAVSITGRIVDRNSDGIAGATLELRNWATEALIGTAVSDAAGNYTFASVTTFAHYVLRASKLDYSFAPQKRTFINLSVAQTNADFTGTLQVQPSDFDGDGKSDVAVWRPSTGVWYVNRSTDNGFTAAQFGGASFGDVVVPGNYDGDKKIDHAVYRKGVWYIMNSSNGSVRTVQFGLGTDIPVPGDYDGDGRTDVAVWRPGTATWYIWSSSDNAITAMAFGLASDMPVAGDYDGDGLTDIAVWRPSTGTWYVQRSSDGTYAAAQFGQTGDMPLVGDFDGDKKVDFTVFRPSNGYWYIMQSSNGESYFKEWGIATDKPVPGDYDRDGKTDLAVFRESDGNWYIIRSSTGVTSVTPFGQAGDIPIPAAYVR